MWPITIHRPHLITNTIADHASAISLLSGDFILPSELANQALIPSRDVSGLHALPNPLKRLETLETKHALARDILHRPIAYPMDVPAVLERAAAVKASLDMPNRRARAEAAREEFMADINAFTKTHASNAAESMIKVAKSKITMHKAEAAAVRNAGWVLSMCTISETHPDGLSNDVVGAVFGADELKGPLNGHGAVRSVDHFRGMTPSERAGHRAAAREVFRKGESAFARVKGLNSRIEAQADGASEILNGTNKVPQGPSAPTLCSKAYSPVQPNSLTNGPTNGPTKPYANGRTNGHAEGHFKPVPDGHSNGQRKANRHQNGHGHTNGNRSGDSHPNGLSNGAVNGNVINDGDVAHTGCCIVILRSLQDQLIDAHVSTRHATDVNSLNLAQIDRMTLTIADLNTRLSAAEENVAVARRNNNQLKHEKSLLDDANGFLGDLSRRSSRQSTPSSATLDSSSDGRSQSSQGEELAESQSALERAIADQLATAQQLSRAEEELSLSRISLSAAKTAHGDTPERLRLAQTQLAAQRTQADEIVGELELVKAQKASLTSALGDTEAELEEAKTRLVTLRSISESNHPSPAELTELLELREQMKQLDYLRQRLKEQDLKEEQMTNAPCTRCKRTHVPHCACCPARPARGVGLAPPKAKVSKSRSPTGTLCYRTPRTSPTGTLVIHTPSGTLRIPMASSSVSPRSASRRSPSTQVTVRGVLQRLSPRSSPGQPKFALRPLIAGKGNLKLVNGKFHLRSPKPPKAVEVTVIEESAPSAETEALETTTSAEDWEDAADDPTPTTPAPPAPNNTPFKPKPQGRHRLGARPMQPLEADVFSSIKSPAPIMGTQDSAPSTVSSETSSAVPTFVVPKKVRLGIPRFSQVSSEAQVQTGGDAEDEDMEPFLPVLRLTEPSLDGIAVSVTLDTSAVVHDLDAVKEKATEKQEPSAPHIHRPTPQQPQTPPRTANDIFVDSVDRSNWAVTMRGNLHGSTPVRSPIGAADSPLDDSPSFLATLSAESAISVESPQQLAPAADETYDSDLSFPYSNSGRNPWDTPSRPSRYDDSHITGFTASPTPTLNQAQSEDNEGDGRSVGNAADIPSTSPNSLGELTSFASSASSASVANGTMGLSVPAGDAPTSAAVVATPGTPDAAEAGGSSTPEGPVSNAAGSPRSHWGSVCAKEEKETKPVECSTAYEDAVECAARFNVKAKELAKPSPTSSPCPPLVEKCEAGDMEMSAREASDETELSFDVLVDERSKEDVVAPLAPAVEHVARPVDADTHIASVLDNMIGAQDAELLSVTDALGDFFMSSTPSLASSTITELFNSFTLTSLTPNNAIEIRTAIEHTDTALILPDHSFGLPGLNLSSDNHSDAEPQVSAATTTNPEGAAPSDPELDAALAFFQSQQAAASTAGKFDPELAENEHLVGLSKAGDEGKAEKEATETDAAHGVPTEAEALALIEAYCANATGLETFDTSVFLPLPQVQGEMSTPPPEAGEGMESEEYTVETYTLLDQVKAEAVQIPSFLPTPLPVPSAPSAGPSWSAPVPDAHVDNSDIFSEISEFSQIDGIPVVYRHQVPDSPVDNSDNLSEITELSQIDGIPVVYRHQIDNGVSETFAPPSHGRPPMDSLSSGL